MQPIRDLAIVLRSTQYEERHRVVIALTQNFGQIAAMARNSVHSRRFGGSLEPFTASEWIFTYKPGAELCQLVETQVREGFEGLRKNFERLSFASVLNELMLKSSPRNEPCSDLFRLHSNSLLALSGTLQPGTEIFLLNGYLAKLLQWNGSQPRLQACMGCKIPLEEMNPTAELSCIISDASWICPHCRHREAHALKLSPLAVEDFQLSLQTPIRQIPNLAKASQKEHKDLFKFLEALYVYHIPGFDKKPLKSLRFLGLESSVQLEGVNLQ